MTELSPPGKRPLWLAGLNALVVFSITVLSWWMARFWRRLWRQPRLAAGPHPEPAPTTSSLIEQACHIAAANVHSAIEERPLPDGQHKHILCAGWRNFREPWARDFGFASFGLIELDEIRVLKETLEVFLYYQTNMGRFPVKVHATSVVERFLHAVFQRQQPIHAPLRPKHRTAHNTISLDGNALIVIAALNYLRRVRDQVFAVTHWQALKRGLSWLEGQALAADGLLHQGAFTDWADSIKRVGCIHYTNVLYWKALHDFARDAARYGYKEDEADFTAKADQLEQAINDHFWHEEQGFYSTSTQFSHILSSAGNSLAIAWGLASPAQAHAILDVMAAAELADPVPTQVTNQPYGTAYIAIENRLAGLPHYHTSAAWLWIGGWHVIALVRVGRLQEARELLARMSAVIARDRVVHEVYGRDGRYLSTIWYTSEAPLTWSASMFIYAYAMYERAVKGS
jgi:GH15 family glucan-1,4-alpha-glucosidase